MKTNATRAELEKALAIVNEKYEGNVEFNRFEHKGNRIHFTLRVKSSKGPGHRIGFFHSGYKNRRKLISACWHVHGNFFDALFDQSDKVWIEAARVGRMKGKADNWQDWDCGSMMYPQMLSEACECGWDPSD